MKGIYVNLKRFDVPRIYGGICPSSDPAAWIRTIMDQSVAFGLGRRQDLELVYLLPESLLLVAMAALDRHDEAARGRISIGCQGVHLNDVQGGGNFGAFTTFRPAAAMAAIGCRWAIVGHSEERRGLLDLMVRYDSSILGSPAGLAQARQAINGIVAQETASAFKRGIDVLLCIGESAEERGAGSPEEQLERACAVIGRQLEESLTGAVAAREGQRLVIGYEPLWAIGPGRTPPGAEYIDFIARFIKDRVGSQFGFVPEVVYGGGLKAENVGPISALPSIDGGLVALTRFTGDIAFEPEGLREIIAGYQV